MGIRNIVELKWWKLKRRFGNHKLEDLTSWYEYTYILLPLPEFGTSKCVDGMNWTDIREKQPSPMTMRYDE